VQPYNFYTDNEAGRNIGNMVNAASMIPVVGPMAKTAALAMAGTQGFASQVRADRTAQTAAPAVAPPPAAAPAVVAPAAPTVAPTAAPDAGPAQGMTNTVTRVGNSYSGGNVGGNVSFVDGAGKPVAARGGFGVFEQSIGSTFSL
jgi:hypothetical protein